MSPGAITGPSQPKWSRPHPEKTKGILAPILKQVLSYASKKDTIDAKQDAFKCAFEDFTDFLDTVDGVKHKPGIKEQIINRFLGIIAKEWAFKPISPTHAQQASVPALEPRPDIQPVQTPLDSLFSLLNGRQLKTTAQVARFAKEAKVLIGKYRHLYPALMDRLDSSLPSKRNHPAKYATLKRTFIAHFTLPLTLPPASIYNPLKFQLESVITVGNTPLKIKKILGSGSFGMVYQVIDRNGRPFALKVQQPTHEVYGKRHNKAYCNAFDEFVFAQSMNGPNGEESNGIMQHLAVASHDNTIVTVMELGERSLAKDIQQFPHKSEEEIVQIMARLTSIVSLMHQMNVAHLDIKPENLIVCHTTEGIDIKITDFGLSQIGEPDSDEKISCGTLPFIPEKLNFRKKEMFQNDIFALAVTLLEVCGLPKDALPPLAMYRMSPEKKVPTNKKQYAQLMNNRHFVQLFNDRVPKKLQPILKRMLLNHPKKGSPIRSYQSLQAALTR